MSNDQLTEHNGIRRSDLAQVNTEFYSPKTTNYETQDEHEHFQKHYCKGFFPKTLLRKLLKDVIQENKEGKQKREGNEIQKTSNPGKERNSNHRREVPSEIWPTVLDSII